MSDNTIDERKIILETRLVGDIRGKFVIPSFQRGFRWGKVEVTRLLDDIYTSGTNNYCLQPIVVKPRDGKYRVIDGQQRLTTLFLIYKYLYAATGGFIEEPKFSLSYETRDTSEEFLENIDSKLNDEYIDFYYMSNAYQVIKVWFEKKEKKSVLSNFNKYFDENVKVIWYEVDDNVDEIVLFSRLNIGKIQLTSAELVKATFLSANNNPTISRAEQEEIALQWDTIERELHDDAFWYFLSNRHVSEYQTRIDLVLDLISRKTVEEKETYFTFFYFDLQRNREDIVSLWREIQHTFLLLKDWFEDQQLYHKIGYLITSETKTLQEIYNIAKPELEDSRVTKSEFIEALDEYIRESVAFDSNYLELDYQNRRDAKKIRRLLLLFNVESVRNISEQTQRFPFEQFKVQGSKSVRWSIEHIHAQHSEGLITQREWKEWILLHVPSISALGEETAALVTEMKAAAAAEPILGDRFRKIQEEVLTLLSASGGTEYLDTISNLALLNCSDNSALSNSTFAVKRNAIIEMDKKGQYIPYCTKMIFLKYYTPSERSQLHFWSPEDRKAYLQAMNETLGGEDGYLSGTIPLQEELV